MTEPAAPTFALSHSELATWSTCRRKWYLGYHQRWQVNEASVSPTNVANLGNHVHLALEAHYGYGLDPLAVLRWDYTDFMATYGAWEDDLKKELDYALAMVEGYLQWAAETGLDVGYETVSTEREVYHDVPLPGGLVVRLRGKLDQVVVRESDGALLLRDFKTVGNFDKGEHLVLNQQMRHYALLLSLATRPQHVAGVLFTMLKRSKRTTRATPPFYLQYEQTYNRHDLNATYQRVTSVAVEIARTYERLETEDHHVVAFPNYTDMCHWGCPFYRVCPMMDDGSRINEALQANFVRGDPYSYLSRGRIDQALTAFGCGATTVEGGED